MGSVTNLKILTICGIQGQLQEVLISLVINAFVWCKMLLSFNPHVVIFKKVSAL